MNKKRGIDNFILIYPYSQNSMIMNNAILEFKEPRNETVLQYAKQSKERQALQLELQSQMDQVIEIPLIIGGKEIRTGDLGSIVMPHNHKKIIAQYHKAGAKEVEMAIVAAKEAKDKWLTMSWIERNSIFLKVSEMISTKYRFQLNAATMLGQSKNAYQAEIDSAAEVIDFLRYNAYFVSQIYNSQPISEVSHLNRVEYRPLEGFVLAITPFNFTAIAANLAVTPSLMGNTVLWKPASTAILSNFYLMKYYMEAGLPAGVINFIPGEGWIIGDTALVHPDFAGIHFTGSTDTFSKIWRKVADNIKPFLSYPRLVGETGGKNFVVVHSSAIVDEVVTGLIRGAFEYQGQKCSAASRAYIPKSLWPEIKSKLIDICNEIKVGDVADFSNFMNAVIDLPSFERICGYIERARLNSSCTIIVGGTSDSQIGYFIRPTIIETTDPQCEIMQDEIFGPVLAVYIYPDHEFVDVLRLCDQTSIYALTGAIFAKDRSALLTAAKELRYAAGNFYYNDKPTGAVVGQQPFGGARGSGTNDKAGSIFNLVRWTSPRTIKENFIPPTNYQYPFMEV